MPDPTAADSDTPEPTAADAARPEPTPLLAPRDGVPPLTDTPDAVRAVAAALAAGSGPLAVDAERASGFRYSARAYLIQLRRRGAGTVLLDPIPVVAAGDDGRDALAALADAVGDLEWVLHSADQDLPGLAELGLTPGSLYDTELAGRLAGFERVGLAAMVERVLGLSLQKGHGAADWSTRPLPDTWLNYAALDVEVLVELRDAMAEELANQGKTDWAAQEFEHIRLAPPPAPKPDRWRRTSGIHTVKNARTLAAIRELWTARDDLARKRDVAPSRVLPDSAITAAAQQNPSTSGELRSLPVFGGPRQRRQSHVWMSALERARDLPDTALPPVAQPVTGPPPISRWARRDPAAAARLTAVREAVAALSERVHVPVENLCAPDTLRRLCWEWPGPPATDDLPAHVDAVLTAHGARPWQREVVGPVVTEALATADAPEVTDE
ncbi:Ribonuclease D [Rhodococcus sp. PBTS 1]|nr:Ribonuclease D [Rhodococcus sp. PBTS 1]